MPLDEGDVNIYEMLELTEETGSDCVIEVKTIEGLEQSVRWLKEHGKY